MATVQPCSDGACAKERTHGDLCAEHFQQYLRQLGIDPRQPTRKTVKPRNAIKRQSYGDLCSREGCIEPRGARKGLCAKHYNQQRYQARRGGPPCAHPGCGKSTQGNGGRLCPMHARRQRLGQDMDAPGKRGRPPTHTVALPCSHPGCGRPEKKGGLCTTHYWRQYRGHDMDGPPRIEGPCIHPGCGRPSHTRKGYCQFHYDRKRKNLSLDKPPPMKELPCSYPGCDRPGKARGLCKTHYHRWLMNGTTVPKRRTSQTII